MKDKESTLVVDYKERFIWLDGGINPKVAYQFKRMLSKLNKLIKNAPIVFYVRGPGGDPHSTFSMMHEIENSSNPVAIVAHGCVGSGCFTITQAGSHRLAMPRTKFGFHPSAMHMKGEIVFSQKDLIDNLERLRVIDSLQLRWFSKRGRPTKKIFDLFREDAWISMPQARKLHLIDDYYKTEDFLKDRRIVRKLIKAKS